MSLRVVTVVISHDQPTYLANCLEAIEKLSFRPERVLVLDSSTQPEVQPILDAFAKKSSNHAVISIEGQANFAELAALAIKQALTGYADLTDVAIWLLHEDSVPEIHSLAELVRTLELSPLVGIASPKQLSIDNPKLIVQQGLTITKRFKPFSIVSDELDQKQHDGMSDVLAASTNGMLIRANLWAELGGFSLTAPELARDIEFCIRSHHAGFRVVVVPTARVRHAELAIHGKRDKHWLGGSTKYALAKATNHLRLSQLPMALSLLYWLALPAISVLQIFWLMLVKRPDRIWLTIRANFWAFFTLRSRVRDRHGLSNSGIRKLFASRAQVKTRARQALEHVEQELNLAKFEQNEETVSTGLGFAASGGLWIMLALAGISYAFFPIGQALTGGLALPLSDSWLQLFANTGSSYQHIGLGLNAPSDPFTWVLLTIGSITFWNPNLALTVLLFMAKPLAFFGAWRLVSLVTRSATVRIFIALAYTFIPALSLAQAEGNYPAVIFSITLPWLLFSLARSARIGLSSSVRSVEQSWAWLGASALLLVVAASSAPSVLPLLALLLIAFAIQLKTKFTRAILITIPTLGIHFPYVIFQLIENKQPLALLADPTIALARQQKTLLQAVATDSDYAKWAILLLAVLAIISLLTKAKAVFTIWIFATLSLINLWFIYSVDFTFGGLGSIFLVQSEGVKDSEAPSVMAISILLLLAVALLLGSISRKWLQRASACLVLAASFSLIAFNLITPNQVKFSESRNLPALFTAQANNGSELRLLVITAEADQNFRAEVIRRSGLRLDALSTAYRMSEPNTNRAYPGKQELALLVANLVSANGQKLTEALKAVGVGYILVPNQSNNGEIQLALNTAAELDQAGTTEFGQLWRVKHPNEILADNQSRSWSVTKAIQLSVLIGFSLLALPTARGRKRRISNDLAPEQEQE
ncbi:MAG: hypothetical protein RIQ88_410 [Actinomycetota bacterium]